VSDLYFTGDWIIRPAVNYVRLAGLARELGCELSLVEGYHVTPDKLVLMRFALRAPALAAFEAFMDKTGPALGQINWQPSSAEIHSLAQPFDLHLLDTEFLTRWMDAMHAYGQHNAALLRDQP
jgi:hypothetical protein